jgi:hypothetical protein
MPASPTAARSAWIRLGVVSLARGQREMFLILEDSVMANWSALWRRKVKKEPGRRAHLHLEPLEERNLLTGLAVVPSPNIKGSVLTATAAIADNDIWAIGNIASSRATLAEHFNGSKWSVVPTPAVNGGNFASVAGAASNDVWVVGNQTPGNGTLIEHWNGTSWSVVPGANVPNGSFLLGVTAVASNDVWAVGAQPGSNSLIEHWDGTSWSVVPSPQSTGSILKGVSADSANDVWAVGANGAGLVEHWNGQTWSVVPSPSGDGNPNNAGTGSLNAVTALSPTNVWAVGTRPGPPPTDIEPAIEHWDGTSWVFVAPAINAGRGVGIAAVSADNIWAIIGGGAEQWNGTSWGKIANPKGVNQLDAVTALSDGTVVAVGVGTNNSSDIVSNNASKWPSVSAATHRQDHHAPTGDVRPPAGASQSSTGTGLHVVASPFISNSSLDAAAIITANDIWAVGDIQTGSTTEQTLAEHFDGTSWSVVPTPSFSNAVLNGVAGAASNDVWAVGSENPFSSSSNTLIEHWNGTSWSVVPSPRLPKGSSLTGVTAPASNNVWAVGFSPAGALVEHFDGTSWSIVSSPAFTGVGGISAVSADSSTDVWAVGGSTSLHWDGHTWSQIATAHLRTGGVVAVSALSPTNVWAVGTGPGVATGGFSAHPTAVIEHWDGTRWSVVPSPNPNPQGNNSLVAVAAVSANDIWAVGHQLQGPFTEHWDGNKWSIVNTPSGVASLIGMTALSDGTVVAVGQGTNGSAVILHN